jgi:hypothetical protein
MESILGDIGLGSLVVDAAGITPLAMVIAAMDGDHAYCVSTDAHKSVRQWRHRSTLKQAVGQRAFD